MQDIEIRTEESTHGGEVAKKYIFKTKDGRIFEASSFWQSKLNRYDLCVSSAAGCLRGCKFCECTYKRFGNEGNLFAMEIFYQIKVMITKVVADKVDKIV